MAELNEAYAAVGDPEARAETSPPAGWPQPEEPAPRRRPPRRRLRRVGRVVLGLVLLAAMIAIAAAAVVYVRDKGNPADVAVTGTLAEAAIVPLAEPPPETQPASGFTTDGEGCMLWRQYELQAGRSAELLRSAIALARVGPDDDAERRRQIRELVPLLEAATLQLRDARALARGQERDAGVALPWQRASVKLHQGAQALRAYYRRHADAGTMERRVSGGVSLALDAVRVYDGVVLQLDGACS
jgi:hypothetical protein